MTDKQAIQNSCFHLTMLLAKFQALIDYGVGFTELWQTGLYVPAAGEACEAMARLVGAAQMELNDYVEAHSEAGFTLPDVDAGPLLNRVL